ncbi:MAG: hypothetical protein ACREN5_15685, partial [Gemmatimonadales bacterium]
MTATPRPPPPAPELRQMLAHRDPSLALAVAALLRRAGPDGAVLFGELAVAYTEDYLDLRRRTLDERLPEGGVLSVDQVRGHLMTSVLPRLVTDGVLEPVPEAVEYDTRLQWRAEHWASLARSVEQARE